MVNYDARFCEFTRKWKFLVYNVILPTKQAGAELDQAQIKLELGFVLNKI